MSQANVDLILSLQPSPEVDLAQMFRSDESWATLADGVASLLHQDFECVNPGAPGEQTHRGAEGFRAFWLDWLEPWASYRAEIEKAIDCGDRVVVLAANFGRPHGGSREIKVSAGSVYEMRDGKIVRYEGYLDQVAALAAVGLAQ
jgi:ketosteroid isomerase-like protein